MPAGDVGAGPTGVLGEARPDLYPEEKHRRLITAAWRGLRPGGVVSHASAAILHGLPVPSSMLDRVWVTRPGRGGRISPLLHLCRADLDEGDVVEVDGMATTSITRTCLDLTRRLGFTAGVILADAALHRDADRLALMEGVRRGVRGDARARRTLAFADGRSESPTESRSRVLMHQLGIEIPDLQVEIYDERGFAGRCDFCWRERRLLGEYDGRGKYLRDSGLAIDPAEVVWREKRREDRLRRCDYDMVRWTKAELADPPAFRRLILGALAACPPRMASQSAYGSTRP